MQYEIGFQEQDFRNKLFRTSFLEQLFIHYHWFTLSFIASSKKDCNNNGEHRCSDNGDGCGGSV